MIDGVRLSTRCIPTDTIEQFYTYCIAYSYTYKREDQVGRWQLINRFIDPFVDGPI